MISVPYRFVVPSDKETIIESALKTSLVVTVINMETESDESR